MTERTFVAKLRSAIDHDIEAIDGKGSCHTPQETLLNLHRTHFLEKNDPSFGGRPYHVE